MSRQLTALLICLALAGCLRLRPSEPGKPASVSEAQAVFIAIWPVIESITRNVFEWLLDQARPAPAYSGAEAGAEPETEF